MNNIAGVDIGAKGALALLSPDGELLEIADMPILRDGPANRPNVNAPLLASIVRRWRPSRAFRLARMAQKTRPVRKPSDDGRATPNCSRA